MNKAEHKQAAMKKRKEHPFSKDVYLLGSDTDGTYYWLEAPSWDCEWYWGFGYIETYTNNKLLGGTSRDIRSHSHAVKFMSEYFTEWNGSKPILEKTTFTEKEGWELSELFEQFYHLSQQAEFYKNGKMNVANTEIKSWKDEAIAKKINAEMIPVVIGRIIEILSPQQSN